MTIENISEMFYRPHHTHVHEFSFESDLIATCARYPCGPVSDLVTCEGQYGHQYPFHDALDATRIMWAFMRNYSSQASS